MCLVGTMHTVTNYTPHHDDKKENEVQTQYLLTPSLDEVGSERHLFCEITSDRTQEKTQHNKATQ
jgi:hypothetical protein